MDDEVYKPIRGRPPTDVSSQIAAHFRAEQDKGRTVSEIAGEGLDIYEIDARSLRPKRIRKMRGKHLEAEFRKIEHGYMPVWLQPDYRGGEVTFLGQPLPVPLGVAALGGRRRGRPKKTRK